jgi:hypothetical protein
MASPVYSAGTPGNLINGVTVTFGKAAIAAFLDLSTSVEGQITCEVVTGSSAPSIVTVFSVFKAYAAGSSPPATLTASAPTGTASLSVSSKTGLSVGQTICLQQHVSGNLGELAKITGITGSSAPYTITMATGILNTYSTGDYIYLMAQSATFVSSPSSSTGTYVSGSDYSSEIFLGPAQWIVAALNSDGAYNVTANVTYDRITSFQ